MWNFDVRTPKFLYKVIYRNFRHDETNSAVCKIKCRNDSEQEELQLYVLDVYTNLDNFMVCPLQEAVQGLSTMYLAPKYCIP